MRLLGALVFGAVLALVLALRLPDRRRRRDMERLIGHGIPEEPVAVKKAEDDDDERPSHLPFLHRLEAEAKQAGISATGRQFALVALGVGAGAYAGAMVLTGSVPIAFVASLVGLLAPRWWLAREKKKRAQVFAKQLDGALMLLSGSLRAGASLSQSLSKVASETVDPLQTEFKKVDKAVQLGMLPAEALAAIRERVASPELDLMVVTTKILTRSGGNLAEIYDKVAQAVRDQRNFRDSVRAHTAQARSTATVVTLIPLIVTAFVRLLNPHYFDPMLRSASGKILFLGAFAVIGMGWVVISRMIDVSLD
ncbi:MAG: type II secretion system F family protein [Bacillota bacterium]